jgi:hypothetical protein
MKKLNKTFLFLDDDAFHVDKIRNPEIYYSLIGSEKILDIMNTYETVIRLTTVEEAIEYILTNGCPNFISFDNDLMTKLEGIDLARWLVDNDLKNTGFIPEDFQFFVHSQNPIAKVRIYSYLGQYLEYRELNNKPFKI